MFCFVIDISETSQLPDLKVGFINTRNAHRFINHQLLDVICFNMLKLEVLEEIHYICLLLSATDLLYVHTIALRMLRTPSCHARRNRLTTTC